MASIRKSSLFSGLALLVLGASVIAVTTDGSPDEEERSRPPAVSPESEAPNAAEMARRARAIPQPSGKRTPGQDPIAPLIAYPQR